MTRNYGNGIEGSKYQSGQDIKDIAKLVRAEIKTALPGFKYSVSIERYLGGQSLNVQMVSAPDNFIMVQPNPNYSEGGWGQDSEVWDTSDAYEQNQEKVKTIVSAYNYDDCDVQSDYFDVNFYLRTGRDYAGPAEQMFQTQKSAIQALTLQAA